MKIQFHSEDYTVTAIKRKSKARYAKNIQVGDVISFKLPMQNRMTHYSLEFEMYVNGEYKTSISQGEIFKILGCSESVFLVDSLSDASKSDTNNE